MGVFNSERKGSVDGPKQNITGYFFPSLFHLSLSLLYPSLSFLLFLCSFLLLISIFFSSQEAVSSQLAANFRTSKSYLPFLSFLSIFFLTSFPVLPTSFSHSFSHSFPHSFSHTFFLPLHFSPSLALFTSGMQRYQIKTNRENL